MSFDYSIFNFASPIIDTSSEASEAKNLEFEGESLDSS